MSINDHEINEYHLNRDYYNNFNTYQNNSNLNNQNNQINSRPLKQNYHNIPNQQGQGYIQPNFENDSPSFFSNDYRDYQMNQTNPINPINQINQINQQQYQNIPTDYNYNELKNAYLSQLMNERNYNQMMPSSYLENNNININNRTENYDNNMTYNTNTNTNTNNIQAPTKPNKLGTDKDLKRQKQEEYRKYLDMQMKELNFKKDQNKKGKANNTAIQERASVNNINQINNSVEGGNLNQIKSVTPLLNPEKEMEKRKKMEYQNELLKQIEENKKRQDLEKQKQREQEMKFEERYSNTPIVENRKGKARQLVSGGNTVVQENLGNNNLNSIGSVHLNNQNNIINQIPPENNSVYNNYTGNQQQPQFNKRENTGNHNKNYNNLPELTEDYQNFRDRQFKSNQNIVNNSNNDVSMMNNMNNLNNMNNINISSSPNYNNNYVQPTPKIGGNFHYTGNNKPIDENNIRNTPQNFYSPNTGINNANVNTFSQFNENHQIIPENPYKNYQPTDQFPYQVQSPLINSYNYSNINSARSQNNQNQVLPQLIEEMLKMFFQEQVKVINQYHSSLIKISEERDNAIVQNMATREKQMAMKQLMLEQERFKSQMGFYPIDKENYNYKLEEMFNSMMDKANIQNKPQPQREEVLRQSEKIDNPRANKGNYKVIEDDRPISGMKVDPYNQIEEEEIEENIKVNYNEDFKVDYLDFRSKYEDLSQSMVSISLQSESKLPNLITGPSKFVCINPREIKDESSENAFLTTWREDVSRANINLSKVNPSNLNSYMIEKDIENEMFHRHDETLEIEGSNYNDSIIHNRKVANSAPFKPHDSVFSSHRDFENFVIGKNDKDRSIYMGEADNIYNEEDPDPEEYSHYDNNFFYQENVNQNEEDNIEEINVNYENCHENYYNPDYKINESEEEEEQINEAEAKQYEESFHNHNEKLEQNEQIDLNDYKEIHETQKLQTKVNFFETSQDNYELTKRSQVKHVINTHVAPVINQISISSKPDPKDRLPRDITVNNIYKLNNIYDQYKKNLYTEEEEEDEFMHSINKFNDNLRQTVEDNAQFHINSNSNSIKAKKDQSFSYVNMATENSDKKTSVNYNRHNPIDDLNNEDSLIKDLTKFTKFALNEINQSE